MEGRVVVLNQDYSFLNTVSWRRALQLMMSDKVEVVKYGKRVIITATKVLRIPAVLKLIKLVRYVYRTKVPFNKKNVLVRDEFKCQYCGSNRQLTIDHILPKSRGGKDKFENCVASCLTCNNSKGNKTPREAGMFLKKREYHQPTIMEFLMKRMRLLGIDDLLKELGVY